MPDPIRRPRMIVVAGPQGAGKTTVRRQLDLGFPAVDTEDHVRRLTPSHPGDAISLTSAAAAETLVDIQEHIAHRRTFVWETHLTEDWSERIPVRNFSPADYDLELLFVGISDPGKAFSRVDDRDYAHGTEHRHGHLLEDLGQISFNENFRNLASAITVAQFGTLYENTSEPLITIASIKTVTVAGIQEPRLLVHKDRDYPPWLAAIGIKIDPVPEEDFLAALGDRAIRPWLGYGDLLHHGLPPPSTGTPTPTTKPTFEPGRRSPPQSVRHAHRCGINM